MQHYKEKETYKIIGICMEVHRNLSPGLLEVVYKDALEVGLLVNFQTKSLQYKRYIL